MIISAIAIPRLHGVAVVPGRREIEKLRRHRRRRGARRRGGEYAEYEGGRGDAADEERLGLGLGLVQQSRFGLNGSECSSWKKARALALAWRQ